MGRKDDLANVRREMRRIASLKRHGPRDRPRSSQPFQAIQQPLSQVFGNSNSNNDGAQQQQNPFTFGTQSQSFGGTSQNGSNAGQGPSQSASFPPFSSIAPPNTSFDFTANTNTPLNNPFATAANNNNGHEASRSGGNQNSMFKFPSTGADQSIGHSREAKARKKEADHALADSAPMWANGSNPFTNPSDQNNAADQQQQTQPTANGFDMSSAPQNQQASSLFGQRDDPKGTSQAEQRPFSNISGNTQPSQPVFNPFAPALSQQPKSNQTFSNIFGNAQSDPTSTKSSNLFKPAPSQQPTANMLGRSQTQQHNTSQPAPGIFDTTQQQSKLSDQNSLNLFGTAQAQHSASSQRISNIFGHSQSQQDKPLGNIFGENSSNLSQAQQPTSPTQNNDDSMSTTPDNSPSGTQQASRGSSAFPNPPASPSPQGIGTEPEQNSQQSGSAAQDVQSSAQNQGGSLFDRISRPTGQKQGSSLFVTETRLSESKGQSSQVGVDSANLGSSSSKNVFTGFGGPSADTSDGDGGRPARSEFEAPNNVFSSAFKPSGEVTQGFSNTQSLASGDKSIKPGFPGIGQVSATPTSNSHKPLAIDDKQSEKSSGLFAGIKHPFGTTSLNESRAPQLPAPSSFDSLGNAALQGGDTSVPNDSAAKADRHKIKTIQQSKRRTAAPPTPPSDFSEDEKQQSVTGYRLKAFDAGFKKHFGFGSIADLQAALAYFQARRETILNTADHAVADAAGSKRKTPPIETSEPSPAKKARFESTGTSTVSLFQPSNAEASNGNTSFTQNGSGQFGETKQLLPKKRNSDLFLTAEDPRRASDGVKKIRSEGSTSSFPFSSPNSSQSSNILKGILESPENQPASAPESTFSNLQNLLAPAKVPTANMSSPVRPFLATTEGNAFGHTASPAKSSAEGSSPGIATSIFKPPTFGSGVPLFTSQHQQTSKKGEQENKRKDEAQDLQSGENETPQEREYEEGQGAKRQKHEGLAKGTRYHPGKEFESPVEEPDKTLSNKIGADEESSAPGSRASSVSVLDQPRQPLPNGMANIFEHLSSAGSGAEGSKTGDADDEETTSEEFEGDEDNHSPSGDLLQNGQLALAPTSSNTFNPFSATNASNALQTPSNERPASRSLFDRIEKDKDGNPVREFPAAEEKRASSGFNFSAPGINSSSLFMALSSSQPLATTPTAKQIFDESSKENTPGDHTWKTDTPIKLGGVKTRPEVNVTSPGSPKPILGGLFGKPPASASPKGPTAPPFSLFQKSPDVGFGISIAKPTGSLAPSDANSKTPSRATSPGASTMSESGTDAVEDDEEKHEQIDLASLGPGEEDLEILFQVRGKALELDADKKNWLTKGVGPVRVLRHPDSGKTRILMRSDPSGKIILNSALLNGVTYKYTASRPKAVDLPFVTDSGKMATLTLTVGKATDAVKLAGILEENKKS